jgi:hypothetical protein
MAAAKSKPVPFWHVPEADRRYLEELVKREGMAKVLGTLCLIQHVAQNEHRHAEALREANELLKIVGL